MGKERGQSIQGLASGLPQPYTWEPQRVAARQRPSPQAGVTSRDPQAWPGRGDHSHDVLTLGASPLSQCSVTPQTASLLVSSLRAGLGLPLNR